MKNLLYEKLQLAKEANVVFKKIPFIFTLSSNDDKNTVDHFTDPNEVIIIEYNKFLFDDLDNAILITIPLTNRQIQLEMLEVPTSFYNYRVVTSDGKNSPPNKSIKHYRGTIKDDPDSIVAMSFSNNEVMGVIATDKGNFNLGLDSELKRHIFYNENNLKEKMRFQCRTNNDGSLTYDQSILFQKSKSAILSNDVCVGLYLETEFDIFQTRGSVESVENFIVSIYNQVATLYLNENIETRLSEIFVWNTPDPYTAVTADNLLSEFQSHRTSFNGDLGQLLTFRTEVGGGKAAGFNGLCNTSIDERLSVSMIFNSYHTYPIYSWTVQIITHEFGHLFGSRHTHACVWNGNNTAIDGCAGGTEGGCPIPDIPSAGGTIMSYCHLQSVGINFNLGFGSQPGNVIRNNVANANCLLLCQCFDLAIDGPETLCSLTSETYTLINLPSGSTVNWSAVPSNALNISGSGSSVTITPTIQFSNQATLIASINGQCESIMIEKIILEEIINVTDVFAVNQYGQIGKLCRNSSDNYFEIITNPYLTGVTYEVEIRHWPSLITVFTMNTNSSITPLPPNFASEGQFQIRVRVINNPCADDNWTSSIFEYLDDCISSFWKTSSNPIDKTLNIFINEEHTDNQLYQNIDIPYLSIILYDLTGRNVTKGKYENAKFTLDTTLLPEGIYLLHIRSKDGDIMEKRVVVIKR